MSFWQRKKTVAFRTLAPDHGTTSLKQTGLKQFTRLNENIFMISNVMNKADSINIVEEKQIQIESKDDGEHQSIQQDQHHQDPEEDEEEEEEVVPVQVQLPPKEINQDDYKSEQKIQEDLSKSQNSATNKVMRSLAGCLINEIQSSRIDYSLLRELNNKSALEYIEMTERAKLLLQSMQVMNEQENQLMQELTKIDDLVEEANKLDSVVRKLDEYTKNLHAQFHKLYSSK